MTACQLPGAGAVWRECRLRSPLTGSRDLLHLIIAALTRRASQIVRPLDQGYGPVPLKCVPCGLFVLELLLLPMSPCSWRAPEPITPNKIKSSPKHLTYRFFLPNNRRQAARRQADPLPRPYERPSRRSRRLGAVTSTHRAGCGQCLFFGVGNRDHGLSATPAGDQPATASYFGRGSPGETFKEVLRLGDCH